ncbi:hypothetical protein ACS0ZG_15960 [Burkholderia gladioli]|uniref:hypothetical protein n=1 Tax=Burkholderia gladioli TaxID=28095 RepID=UPI00163FF7C3|nr:hypothetical protein [Burkholderia gladioli]MDA0603855.1 hypothetical protein [Burkholderia gladioli]
MTVLGHLLDGLERHGIPRRWVPIIGAANDRELNMHHASARPIISARLFRGFIRLLREYQTIRFPEEN